ncbi:hypothetical protein FN846DRAFT_903702 [Sphaerosporella brunnea]|uniref:Uncharacterized protein n=1 Tax=Sphaerosporella brunnea TaxID=1250544 RepID=A0A5J5F646_9PEZI|nr:hypothetical protein FN846DRAFT_903702 [Sphaerosporella brunnea]
MSCQYEWCAAPQLWEHTRDEHMRTHHHNYYCGHIKRYYPVEYKDDDSVLLKCVCACTVDRYATWPSREHAEEHEEKIRQRGGEGDEQHRAHMASVRAPIPAQVIFAEDYEAENSPLPERMRRRRKIEARRDAIPNDDDDLYAAPLPPRQAAAVEDFHFSDYEDDGDAIVQPRLVPITPQRKLPYASPAHCSDEDEVYTTPLGTRRQIRCRVAAKMPSARREPILGTRENPWDRCTPVAKVKTEHFTPEVCFNSTPAFLRDLAVPETPPPKYGSW